MTYAPEPPPTRFDLRPHHDRWFHWNEVSACFWPGRGKRSRTVNPDLGPVASSGGIYLLAWSDVEPSELHPRSSKVRYVGETGRFKERMGYFSKSAGFSGDRMRGHSGGWRWPQGECSNLWVAFFVAEPVAMPDYLRKGLRPWLEALAIHEHVLANGRIPLVNVVEYTRTLIDFS